MNEVSIIINGVRYDAVKVPPTIREGEYCMDCDLYEKCEYLQDLYDIDILSLCANMLTKQIFKKSDKKFEP